MSSPPPRLTACSLSPPPGGGAGGLAKPVPRRLLVSIAAAFAFLGGLNMAHAQPSLAPSFSEPLHVYAAGSLREALTEIARAYEARTGRKIQLTFGASGLL